MSHSQDYPDKNYIDTDYWYNYKKIINCGAAEEKNSNSSQQDRE